MSNLTALKPAESPFKQNMLEVVDELRQMIVEDEILGVAFVRVEKNRKFGLINIGKITNIELLGFLQRSINSIHKEMDNDI